MIIAFTPTCTIWPTINALLGADVVQSKYWASTGINVQLRKQKTCREEQIERKCPQQVAGFPEMGAPGKK
jgi:hypothetical protein